MYDEKLDQYRPQCCGRGMQLHWRKTRTDGSERLRFRCKCGATQGINIGEAKGRALAGPRRNGVRLGYLPSEDGVHTVHVKPQSVSFQIPEQFKWLYSK